MKIFKALATYTCFKHEAEVQSERGLFSVTAYYNTVGLSRKPITTGPRPRVVTSDNLWTGMVCSGKGGSIS